MFSPPTVAGSTTCDTTASLTQADQVEVDCPCPSLSSFDDPLVVDYGSGVVDVLPSQVRRHRFVAEKIKNVCIGSIISPTPSDSQTATPILVYMDTPERDDQMGFTALQRHAEDGNIVKLFTGAEDFSDAEATVRRLIENRQSTRVDTVTSDCELYNLGSLPDDTMPARDDAPAIFIFQGPSDDRGMKFFETIKDTDVLLVQGSPLCLGNDGKLDVLSKYRQLVEVDDIDALSALREVALEHPSDEFNFSRSSEKVQAWLVDRALRCPHLTIICEGGPAGPSGSRLNGESMRRTSELFPQFASDSQNFVNRRVLSTFPMEAPHANKPMDFAHNLVVRVDGRTKSLSDGSNKISTDAAVKTFMGVWGSYEYWSPELKHVSETIGEFFYEAHKYYYPEKTEKWSEEYVGRFKASSGQIFANRAMLSAYGNFLKHGYVPNHVVPPSKLEDWCITSWESENFGGDEFSDIKFPDRVYAGAVSVLRSWMVRGLPANAEDQHVEDIAHAVAVDSRIAINIEEQQCGPPVYDWTVDKAAVEMSLMLLDNSDMHAEEVVRLMRRQMFMIKALANQFIAEDMHYFETTQALE